MPPVRDNITPKSAVLLKDRRSWPTWYIHLQFQAKFKGIWHLIDPFAADAPHVDAEYPKRLPTIREMIEIENNTRRERYDDALKAWERDNRPEDQRAPRPELPALATRDDVYGEHAVRYRDYKVQMGRWTYYSARYEEMWNWINATVDGSILSLAMIRLVEKRQFSLQDLVRMIKSQVAPTETSSISTTRLQIK
jgi:hypothetical protein